MTDWETTKREAKRSGKLVLSDHAKSEQLASQKEQANSLSPPLVKGWAADHLHQIPELGKRKGK
jgi:hypothetical protein